MLSSLPIFLMATGFAGARNASDLSMTSSDLDIEAHLPNSDPVYMSSSADARSLSGSNNEWEEGRDLIDFWDFTDE